MLLNVNQRLFRLLCGLALGLILFDDIVCAAGCGNFGESAAACRACSCAAHIVSQNSAPAAVVAQPAAFAAYETPGYALVLPEPIFHPPR